MNYGNFISGWNRITGAYPQYRMPPGRMEMVYAALQAITDDEFMKACDEIIGNENMVPTVKVFEKYASDYLREAKRRASGGKRQEAANHANQCDLCDDSGVFECQEIGKEQIYFIRCTCAQGGRSAHDDLPRWDFRLHAEKFKPLFMCDGRRAVWANPEAHDLHWKGWMHIILPVWNEQKRKSIAFWGQWKLENADLVEVDAKDKNKADVLRRVRAIASKLAVKTNDRRNYDPV